MTTVCEVGPGTVRLLGPRTDCAAAFPIPSEETTADGWRSALQPLLAGASDVLLVHPSWWTGDRVALVAGAAADEGGSSLGGMSRALGKLGGPAGMVGQKITGFANAFSRLAAMGPAGVLVAANAAAGAGAGPAGTSAAKDRKSVV